MVFYQRVFMIMVRWWTFSGRSGPAKVDSSCQPGVTWDEIQNMGQIKEEFWMPVY